jgi:hypothetical protein
MAEDNFVVRNGSFTKPIYTVTTAPAAQGEVVWVSDLTTNPLTTAGLTATGGGTTRGRIIFDGTNKKIYGPNVG